MSSTAELQALPLKRGQKVRLVDDILGYPAGSTGKVALANGFAWLRYWVRFSDGESIGHISHSSLVKAKDYDTFLTSRDREAIEAERAAEAAALAGPIDDSESTGSAGGSDSGGSVVVNGVPIPQIFLDRAAAARIRLAG